MKVARDGTFDLLVSLVGSVLVDSDDSASGAASFNLRDKERRKLDLMGVVGGVGNCAGSDGVATTAKVRSATYEINSSFNGAFKRLSRTGSCIYRGMSDAGCLRCMLAGMIEDDGAESEPADATGAKVDCVELIL